MKAVIFGGSAGMGRAIAEQLASRHADVLLVASDARDLDAVRSDLLLKYGTGKVSTLAVDLAQAEPEAVVGGILDDFGKFDAMFLVAGLAVVGDSGVLASAAAERLVKINFVAPALLINAVMAAGALLPNGSIVVLSSVAAARWRGRNVLLWRVEARSRAVSRSAPRQQPRASIPIPGISSRLSGHRDDAITGNPGCPRLVPTRWQRTSLSKLGRTIGAALFAVLVEDDCVVRAPVFADTGVCAVWIFDRLGRRLSALSAETVLAGAASQSLVMLETNCR